MTLVVGLFLIAQDWWHDPVSGQRIVSRLTHHATQLRLDGADRRRTTTTRSPA